MLEKLILDEYLNVCDPAFSGLLSNFSLVPYGLIFLRNELVLNKRKNILEFGSGLSTLFMGQLIKKHGLKACICTIESGEEWISLLKEKVDQLKLAEYIKIIYAPLVEDSNYGKWYDMDILNRELNQEQLFDMIVIDGPPAFNPQIAKSRYRAIPYIFNSLSDNCFIFLDDANRMGEQEIIQLWNSQFNFDFKIYNKRFAVYWKGKYRDSNPSIMNSLLIRYDHLKTAHG
ncbi:class I SAM-dependent methyltransferase [Mucilaginibacter paludis]|uniref:Class I SAM-dependent methyltransferase n=1 Tax=Mucilaginibacter paludis DSM 18603 TaxID=714943 RepID=H1Y1M8_9SPHI|nr:class I SAM-dependent methyltransferase [Mucilaginibacter paludis]EHQ24687.1 hypothetical protein Mucpa_0494 [Mucilaginibacter paludis DSM 18603]